MDANPSHRLLITGGAGFIGSAFIRHILDAYPHWQVLCFDSLTYAGNLHNLDAVCTNPHYHFTRGDVTNPQDVQRAFETFEPNVVVHFAAESHVDRGIENPTLFLQTNVIGTQVLLDAALAHSVTRFMHISTDEIYGAVKAPASCKETAPIAPTNSYAASKAAADLLVQVAAKSWQMPVITLRSTNNYGSHQFPEKLIPLMISRALTHQTLPVYGDGLQCRTWLHVTDFCRAIVVALLRGSVGEVYNVGTYDCIPNIQVVNTIIKHLATSTSSISHVKDRLGHDLRYSLDWRKIADLGWTPKISFSAGLTETIQWYCSHPEWLKQIASGEYRTYNQTQIQEGL